MTITRFGPQYAQCYCGHIAWAMGWETEICQHQQALVASQVATIQALDDQGKGFWWHVRHFFDGPTREQYVRALWAALTWKRAPVVWPDDPAYIDRLTLTGDEKHRLLAGEWLSEGASGDPTPDS